MGLAPKLSQRAPLVIGCQVPLTPLTTNLLSGHPDNILPIKESTCPRHEQPVFLGGCCGRQCQTLYWSLERPHAQPSAHPPGRSPCTRRAMTRPPCHSGLYRHMLWKCMCWRTSSSGADKRERFPAVLSAALQHPEVCWDQCLGFGLQNLKAFLLHPGRGCEPQAEGQGKVRSRLSEASVVLILVSYSHSHTLVCPDPKGSTLLCLHWQLTEAEQPIAALNSAWWAFPRLFSDSNGFWEPLTIKW